MPNNVSGHGLNGPVLDLCWVTNQNIEPCELWIHMKVGPILACYMKISNDGLLYFLIRAEIYF
jgi:hypothetical protein